MWSIGVGAVYILVTRVVSFTLVNVYEITDKKKKWDFEKIVVHKPLPCLKSASRGCFQSFAGLWEREIVVPDEKNLSTQKTYLLITFSQVTVSPILNNLKYGLPRYQNKHQQTTNQTKSHYTIQIEFKGFWD